ncbi:MAG TPA: NAD-dependent epimerase/dehydratase family protein [Vicinamibacterales bacterium]|nr:NAD-dependent epimerase/dehydratase family protein [Vicinamibacterales bacterium]
MRIFLTGGTGYIGSAVLDAFVRAGHHVDALVRNTEKAAEVQARGATPVLGDLSEPATYLDAAAAADGLVLTGFEYSPRGVQVEATTLEAVLALPPKPGSFVIYTSGVWVLGPAPAPVDETAPVNPLQISKFRPAHEQRVLDSANAGWRPVVIRPGIVYGGARGIIGDLLKDASNSLIRVVGPGDNHWPLVYDRDLADLYVRTAVSADASGIYHANDEGDETVNEIVAALSEHAKTQPSVRHVPLAEARQKMGPYADALALDQIVRSPRARALGWHPSLKSVSGNAARLFEEYRRAKGWG